MRLLMLSTDKNILISGSESQRRMMDYGGLVEELHVVVKSHGSRVMDQRFGNVFVYPTNTWLKPLYFFDAYKIAKEILSKFQVPSSKFLATCQDPFETGLVGYLIKKRLGLPLQIQVHTDFLSPYFAKESIKNRIRVIFGKYLIKKADGIRVVSERIKNSLSSKSQACPVANRRFCFGVPSSKISVLPIFVDTAKISSALIKTDLHKKYPDHDFIILMASRLSREKNIGLAIEAMREVSKSQIANRKLLLLIVGDGPELNKLQVLSSKLQVQSNVVFEPWSHNLPSYYKTADLFLLTSNYEGYGRTVVEATAAGLPVLMTDVGVAVGSVVPVGNKKALVSALGQFISGYESEKIMALASQGRVLGMYASKEDYLNQLKQSWENCFL